MEAETQTPVQAWWTSSQENIQDLFHTDTLRGLSQAEAKIRLERYGLNQLPDKKSVSWLTLFAHQFNNFIIWVLFAACLISSFLKEWTDAAAIGFIILLNSVLGFFQEFRAERSLQALRKLSSPNSKVIRDGILQTLPSREIVPGDLICLEAGDRVPADGRLVHLAQLRTQEASLTGESMPVNKTAQVLKDPALPIGDRKNMVFMSTVIVHGKGNAVVTATGLATEIGKIAKMLEASAEEKTPLQKRLEQLGRRLVLIFLGVVAAVFAIGIARGNPFVEMLLTALSLAVAAIPEGLPAIVTIALALGVQRMVKRNALIRRLASVETLGCTSVICTDKTGTLTLNEMVVRNLWVNEKFIQVTGTGYSPAGEFKEEGKIIDVKKEPECIFALKAGVLCNSANLFSAGGTWEIAGDPTEAALLAAALKIGLTKQQLEFENPLLGELPFNSERKRMSMLRNTPQGPVLFVKGAPDIILRRSEAILINGNAIPLTSEYQKKIEAANHLFANQALRVLAVAYRQVTPGDAIEETLEEHLTFAGLVAMMDPPRPEAKSAIEICKKAGIRTVMITGDHKETAKAIAEELGLMEEGMSAINGAELEEMRPEQLEDLVRHVCVYARVSAEHKLKIVRAIKKGGEIVAMTGDGVNDAPAIKEADIGIAMGITGTDVTKEASDMVITDDNFASIVNAVEEGRGIYDNIVKFVNYLLSSNIAEILVLFFGMLFGFHDPQGRDVIPLSAVQLLWMNLVTDGFPAIALGVDPLDPKAMERPPRKSSEPILSQKFMVRIFSISVVIAAGSLAACLWGLRQSAELAQTMTLTTLIVLQLVRVQMVRAEYRVGFFSNPWLIAALASSIFFQLGVIYFPFFQKLFGTVSLGIPEWGVILLIALFVTLAGTVLNRCSAWFFKR